MALAVRARLFYGSALVDGAVEADDVVVAYAVEAPLAMPSVNVGGGERLALGGGGAVDDDVGYFSHGVLVLNINLH